MDGYAKALSSLCYKSPLLGLLVLSPSAGFATEPRQAIKALYIPLADHYAAIVAYERYREQMQYTDFQIKEMGSWNLLRAYFQSGDADTADVMSPLARDMYQQEENYRWIGLMHRDGNTLAVNTLIKKSTGAIPSAAQRP
ncbi:MAG: hypothetical protein KUG81_00185 [Gammaproteobacteria bacterium]|nr:hypothetical protein [Gammaproteobacteria bacterium]